MQKVKHISVQESMSFSELYMVQMFQISTCEWFYIPYTITQCILTVYYPNTMWLIYHFAMGTVQSPHLEIKWPTVFLVDCESTCTAGI